MRSVTNKIAGLIFLFILSSCVVFAHSKTGNSVWKKRVSRIFDLDPTDTIEHHLKDMRSDTSLFDIIDNEVMTGKLTAYDSLGNKYTIGDFMRKPDTTTIEDPVTGLEKQVIVQHQRPIGCYHPKYKLIEEWSFDRVAGNTNIKIGWIVPIWVLRDFDGNSIGFDDIYWLKFDDVINIISSYQEHYPNPNNKLARFLWNDFFLNDVKPAIIK